MSHSNEYREYMNSLDWWEKKREFLEVWNDGRCELCGDGAVKLEVHHLSYHRLGDEAPEDLAGVCRRCHDWLDGCPDRGRIAFKAAWQLQVRQSKQTSFDRDLGAIKIGRF